MFETHPLHIMIKPEGLELFPEYVTSQIELLDSTYSLGNTNRIRTILTPSEVELIYPGESASEALKTHLSEKPTEHFFIHGSEDVYDAAKAMKGKYGNPEGIRGQLAETSKKISYKMEKWQNFLHSSDNLLEAQGICQHFIKDLSTCQSCAAKSVCYGTKGSDMPKNI